MHTERRSIRNATKTGLAALAAALVASCWLPYGALAAPELDVTIERSPEAIPRNYEQLTYTVGVHNVASAVPSAGTVIECNGTPPAKTWLGEPENVYTFTYQWVRDGAPLTTAGDIAAGSQTRSYTVQAADEGHVVQCLVKGTNGAGTGTYVVASQPGTVVPPAPVVTPPAPNNLTAASRRAAIAGPFLGGTESTTGSWAAGEELRCTAPTAGWNGVTVNEWQFQWLRDGAPAPGTVSSPSATVSRYTLTAEDVAAPAAPANFQCLALAVNGGGVAVVESPQKFTVAPAPAFTANGTPGFGPSQLPNQVPITALENDTVGPLELTVDLPAGLETRAFKISTTAAWSCAGVEPTPLAGARVDCTRAASLEAAASAPPIEIVTSVGQDAPDPLMVIATVSGGGAASDFVTDSMSWLPALEFKILDFGTKVADALDNDYTQAGGHPVSGSAEFTLQDVYVRAGASPSNSTAPFASPRVIATDLPPGFLGNPTAAPLRCRSLEAVLADTLIDRTCPAASVVGGIVVDAAGGVELESPIYAVEPERGVPAQFAFAFKPPSNAVYTLVPRLRAEDGYAISIDAPQAPQRPTIVGGVVTLCSYGANLTELPGGGRISLDSCKLAAAPEALQVPLLTNPTRCLGIEDETRLSVDTWQDPGRQRADGAPDLSDPAWRTQIAKSPELTGCEAVPFTPRADLRPTSREADSPTGLDVSISVPTEGLTSPGKIAQGMLKRAKVTLPAGMAVNPSAASGLDACSSNQMKLGTNESVTCPDASKIGSVQVKTPLLEETLEGVVYLGKQGDNPFGTLLSLYLVVESKERGILVKIPGRVDPGPDGRLVTTFDDNPQVPFSSLDLHFNAGDRAPLLNPPKCGTYAITSEMSPWSATVPDAPTAEETRTITSTFVIDRGPDGGPCPTGDLEPKFNAGVTNPVAASTSPLVVTLARDDGSQRFSALEIALPQGLAAYLRGVPYCPDAVLAAIPTAEGTGADELTNPSCLASQIGTVTVGAGSGANPFYVSTGRAVLAGPYKGAPLSIAIVAPAVAGPFDLGNVVVRSAAYIDPVTAQITVRSDTIPTILHGIPLDIRDIRVKIDRPDFTLAPTDCSVKSIAARVGGDGDASVPVSARFQVGECDSLDFGPKLKIDYKGQAKRGGNPGLRAVLTQPGGQANISSTQVILPRGSFIDNEHINNPCTRDQYAANACPDSSILGTATAWSPLLDQPLSGNVYFRSNGGERELPDIVAKLQGQVNVELVGFVDAVVNKKTNTSRVRNTFAIVPDAPVSRFELNMKGGKLGLIENSKNLCKGKHKATVKMTAHNGKAFEANPVVQTSCRKKGKKAKKVKTR